MVKEIVVTYLKRSADDHPERENLAKDIVSYLNSRGYIDYDKSSQNIFNLTKEFLENGTATENAERIQKHQKQANCNHFKVYEWNPYTNINELIGSIFEMQKFKYPFAKVKPSALPLLSPSPQKFLVRTASRVVFALTKSLALPKTLSPP